MRASGRRLVPLLFLLLAGGCKNSLNYAPPGGSLDCGDPGAICSYGYDGVGDGGPALSASFVGPSALAYDVEGNLFVADRFQNRIRRIDTSGNISTIAGTGEESYAFVEGLPATESIAASPIAVAVTDDGTVFWTDATTCMIYAISPTSGTVSVAAGGSCSGGGGLTPDTARFSFDSGSRIRARGNDLVIANTNVHQIRYWNRGSADIVVGGVTVPPNELRDVAYGLYTRDAAIASDGTVYMVEDEYQDCRIRRYSNAAVLSFVVGNGGISDCGAGGDGGPSAAAQVAGPSGIVFDEAANVLVVTDDSGRLRAINLTPGQASYATVALTTSGIASIAGGPSYEWLTLDGGPALTQRFRNTPRSPVLDPNGDLVVADPSNNVIRKVNLVDGNMQVIAGFAEQGTLEGFWNAPATLTRMPGGDLLVAGRSARAWRMSSGSREIFFGNGDPVFSGDGGPAANAGGWVTGLAAADDGRVFIADAVNSRLRVVDPLSGTISTIAGNGSSGSGGDGGLASSASFDGPHGVVVDSSGNLIIADGDRLRYVNLGLGSTIVAGRTIAPQSIDTIAGGNGNSFFGDGGLATDAAINMNNGTETTNGLAVDGSTVYFADTYNNRIRKVDLRSGIIETVVGSGANSDDAVGRPTGIAVHDGWLYWAQETGALVKRLDLANGRIEVVTGDGNTGYFGEGIHASQAQFIGPSGLAVSGNGTIYVTDLSHRVRRIIP